MNRFSPILHPSAFSSLIPQRPFQDVASVRRRAHDSAVLADECFHARRRVDVRNWHDWCRCSAELLPGVLDLVDRGHVGHRAAGGEIGQDDALVSAVEDIGRFRHEMNAAEHDVGRPGGCSAAKRASLKESPRRSAQRMTSGRW